MAMGKKTVNSLGILGVAVIAGGAYFGIAAPILSEKKAVEVEYEQAQLLNQTYSTKLSEFSAGATDETRAAQDTQILFDGLVSDSLDIESASRAIAASLPEGVKLESFDFGAVQQVSDLQMTPPTISGFTPPTEFAGGGAADAAAAAPEPTNEQDAVEGAGGEVENLADSGPQAVDPSAPIDGFNRIPFTIEVSAGSYTELAEYLNSLSDQPRLMSVVSVDSSRADAVTATIYAFAFAGN